MRILIITLLTIVILQSCKKYPDGPLLSIRSREARITNTWVCEKALVGDVESTAFYTKYTFEYGADKSYSEYNGYNTIKGVWELSTNEDSIIVRYGANKILHGFKIQKLKNNSMRLTEGPNGLGFDWYLKSN